MVITIVAIVGYIFGVIGAWVTLGALDYLESKKAILGTFFVSLFHPLFFPIVGGYYCFRYIVGSFMGGPYD